MKIPKIKWERSKAKFSNGDNAMVNGIKVGEVFWGKSTKDDKNYTANFTLPGIRITGNGFDEMKNGKKIVEEAFAIWFKKLTSKEK